MLLECLSVECMFGHKISKNKSQNPLQREILSLKKNSFQELKQITQWITCIVFQGFKSPQIPAI